MPPAIASTAASFTGRMSPRAPAAAATRQREQNISSSSLWERMAQNQKGKHAMTQPLAHYVDGCAARSLFQGIIV